MYIAMNHFHIAAGRGEDFERRLARAREPSRRRAGGSWTSTWFGARMTTTERIATHRTARGATARRSSTGRIPTPFKRAHAQGGMGEGVLLGHPQFNGWESIDLSGG